MTRLQAAAYDAQLAAGLPVSELATATLRRQEGPIDLGLCADYLHAIQRKDWFAAAFTGHAEPVVVVGGPGVSHADAAARLVTIGADDRMDARTCEHACLHELAHIVTPDLGPDHELREPARGESSSRGHHHAWRANFIFIVQMTLGRQAAHRLRHEFTRWDPGLTERSQPAVPRRVTTPVQTLAVAVRVPMQRLRPPTSEETP